MKAPKYILNIENPCHQKWDEMSKADAGRFCHSCNKCVIDFSHLSDNEILKRISNASGEICGKFLNSQLSRELVFTESKPKPLNILRYLAGLFLVGAANTSYSKDIAPKRDTIVTLKIEPKLLTEAGYRNQLKGVPGKPIVIKGRVVDEKGEGMISASIVMKDSELRTVTDYDGYFTLIIPDTFSMNTANLIISYAGYESKEHVVLFSNEQADSVIELLSIKLSVREYYMLGGMSYTIIESSKRSLKRKHKE